MKKLIHVLSNSMGDTLSSIPYVNEYQKKHQINLYVSVYDFFIPYLKSSYPNLNFIGREDFSSFDEIIPIDYDFNTNIQYGYAKQLGFEDAPYIRPKLIINPKPRTIKNKYVAISIHSTLQCKYWNHTNGRISQPYQPNWDELCGLLRKKGYTPVVVEKNESWGISPFYNGSPKKSNKKIGLEFDEVLSLIYHSEFFIGLSSGLSWIAHSLGKKVAMISNFTEDWNEFDLSLDDYIRITNKSVCHGCWNKINIEHKFDSNDWYWCPLHKDTSREFECHKSITPQMVMEQINKWL